MYKLAFSGYFCKFDHIWAKFHFFFFFIILKLLHLINVGLQAGEHWVDTIRHPVNQ